MFVFNKNQFKYLAKAFNLIDDDYYVECAESAKVETFTEAQLRACDNLLKLVDNTTIEEMVPAKKLKRAKALAKSHGIDLKGSGFEYVVFPIDSNEDDELVTAIFDYLCIRKQDRTLLFVVLGSYFDGKLGENLQKPLKQEAQHERLRKGAGL